MIGLETDHVISGPMRGLKLNIIGRGQNSTHQVMDIGTTRLTRPIGLSQLKLYLSKIMSCC